MKKKVLRMIILFIIIVGIVIGIVIGIVYFYSRENGSNDNLNQEDRKNIVNNAVAENLLNTENSNTNNIVENSQIEGVEDTMENARIKLTVNGNEIFVRLDNNQASREFLEMLPLTLTFEDFNNTEKIATLPDELSTEGLPSGYTPEAGDFSYYAPWGNISVFYKDFRYSNSLYKLGTIESGTEILGNIDEDFEVTIERVD